MKAIGVLRFVFLGVGIFLIPMGILVFTYKYSGNPAAEIFIIVAMVSLGVVLIGTGIGLVIASIVMFVKYHKYQQSLKEKAQIANETKDIDKKE